MQVSDVLTACRALSSLTSIHIITICSCSALFSHLSSKTDSLEALASPVKTSSTPSRREVSGACGMLRGRPAEQLQATALRPVVWLAEEKGLLMVKGLKAWMQCISNHCTVLKPLL